MRFLMFPLHLVIVLFFSHCGSEQNEKKRLVEKVQEDNSARSVKLKKKAALQVAEQDLEKSKSQNLPDREKKALQEKVHGLLMENIKLHLSSLDDKKVLQRARSAVQVEKPVEVEKLLDDTQGSSTAVLDGMNQERLRNLNTYLQNLSDTYDSEKDAIAVEENQRQLEELRLQREEADTQRRREAEETVAQRKAEIEKIERQIAKTGTEEQVVRRKLKEEEARLSREYEATKLKQQREAEEAKNKFAQQEARIKQETEEQKRQIEIRREKETAQARAEEEKLRRQHAADAAKEREAARLEQERENRQRKIDQDKSLAEEAKFKREQQEQERQQREQEGRERKIEEERRLAEQARLKREQQEGERRQREEDEKSQREQQEQERRHREREKAERLALEAQHERKQRELKREQEGKERKLIEIQRKWKEDLEAQEREHKRRRQLEKENMKRLENEQREQMAKAQAKSAAAREEANIKIVKDMAASYVQEKANFPSAIEEAKANLKLKAPYDGRDIAALSREEALQLIVDAEKYAAKISNSDHEMLYFKLDVLMQQIISAESNLEAKHRVSQQFKLELEQFKRESDTVFSAQKKLVNEARAIQQELMHKIRPR